MRGLKHRWAAESCLDGEVGSVGGLDNTMACLLGSLFFEDNRFMLFLICVTVV